MNNQDATGKTERWESADQAVEQLFRTEGGRLHSLARRFCKNEQDAQDLVQDVFLTALKKWDQFQGDSKPTTWLYTIAARRCQRNQRRRAGEPERFDSMEELLPFGEPAMGVVPSGDTPEVQALRAESQQQVERAVAGLPVAFRMPLILKDIVGLSVLEVASVLGLQPATVRTRLHRARLKVRQSVASTLPQEILPPTPYSKQVCLDLLAAKQDALDQGVDYPVSNEVVCERCQTLFETLDLGRDLCRQLSREDLPMNLQNVVLQQIRDFRQNS